jgi:hypothetical protein
MSRTSEKGWDGFFSFPGIWTLDGLICYLRRSEKFRGVEIFLTRNSNVARERERRTIKERKYFTASPFLRVSRKVGAAPDLSKTLLMSVSSVMP